MTGNDRLDEALLNLGLAESLQAGRTLVRAGRVKVDGRKAVTPDEPVAEGASLEVIPAPKFVSRGGEKLAAALDTFGVSVVGQVCADVGASTGGFTDCLLQRGAVRVYAIDSGRGQLHWKLRQDERVVAMESTNARHLHKLPEPVGTVTVDASFISLRHLLPPISGWLAEPGQVVALVKPQFEARPEEVDPGGVVSDPHVRRRVLEQAAHWLEQAGLAPQAAAESALPGPKGNRELFVLANKAGKPVPTEELLNEIAW